LNEKYLKKWWNTNFKKHIFRKFENPMKSIS